MDMSVSPAEFINLELFGQIIQQVENDIIKSKYQQLIHDASVAIDHVLQSQLLVLLDVRCNAYAIEGHLELACIDAQRMIKCAPQLATGYIRQGTIWSMYGYQNRAIATYDQGLQYVPTPSNDGNNHNNTENQYDAEENSIEQLKSRKEEARAIINRKIDFFAHLPCEVSNITISLLDKDIRATCLSVSKMWREKIVECKEAWKSFSVNDNEDDMELVNVASNIAPHIEYLIINTADIQKRRKYFECMRNKQFKKIKSLEFNGVAAKFKKVDIILFSTALWQARRTLTKVDVNSGSKRDLVTIPEVLASCTTLTTLNYTTKCRMAVLLGDFSVMNDTHPLTSISIKADAIDGQDMETLLQRCQRLRRITLNGCDESIFEPIGRLAHRLQALCYNHSLEIPQHKEMIDTYGPEAGIKMICGNNNDVGVTFSAIFPLIYKNRKSLQYISSTIEEPTAIEMAKFQETYPEFTLDKLNTLGIRLSTHIQSIFQPSIAGAASIKYLSLINVVNINGLVNDLVSLQRTPETFKLDRTHDVDSTPALRCLFRRYSKRSDLSCVLKNVTFRYCTDITDPVLSSLGEIKTLNTIELISIPKVTTQGVFLLITHMSDRLSRITLQDLDVIDNSILIAIGRCDSLSEVKLESLKNVDSTGVRNLINMRGDGLANLTINKCKAVDEECIKFAKMVVKKVYININT